MTPRHLAVINLSLAYIYIFLSSGSYCEKFEGVLISLSISCYAMIEESWFFTCIIFPVLIGLLYSMVKTVHLDFSLMWLIGLIREQWTWNEILLMSFFPYKTAARTRMSSDSVSMFPCSLQVHGAWALCGQSASFLH